MPSRAEMRKRGYKHRGTNMLTAIIQDVDHLGKRFGRKYHNIKNEPAARERFETFARSTYPLAFMVMYYDGSRAEVARVKLK